ncbi:MAG: hypothetical protein KDD62_03420 [Bdellovibrionales bacterium]|nr:hypothetical protein [Bdellovibrionales bacterium]
MSRFLSMFLCWYLFLAGVYGQPIETHESQIVDRLPVVLSQSLREVIYVQRHDHTEEHLSQFRKLAKLLAQLTALTKTDLSKLSPESNEGSTLSALLDRLTSQWPAFQESVINHGSVSPEQLNAFFDLSEELLLAISSPVVSKSLPIQHIVLRCELALERSTSSTIAGNLREQPVRMSSCDELLKTVKAGDPSLDVVPATSPALLNQLQTADEVLQEIKAIYTTNPLNLEDLRLYSDRILRELDQLSTLLVREKEYKGG